jgi:hypothetical protein
VSQCILCGEAQLRCLGCALEPTHPDAPCKAWLGAAVAAGPRLWNNLGTLDHRERFTALLGEVARKPESKD